MMKKMMLTIILLVMLTDVASAADYSYTIADSGTTKILEPGDTFTIELTENSGSLWAIAPNDVTVDENNNLLSNSLSDGLQLISNEVTTTTMPGAPKTRILTIKATNIGSQSVNVHYFFHGSCTSNKFTLTINVQTPNSTSVPEFPSVIAPIAAILGLIVIFGHRKDIA
jgi:predicted secreted protein